jgi:hypothetical protein
MLREMKKQLIEDVKKAKQNGELTAQQVYNIAYEGVIQAASKLDEEITDLHSITKEAVTVSVQALVSAEETSHYKISAALHGAVDGVKQVETRVFNSIQNELIRVKKRLKKEEKTLAETLRITLNGAQEAADNFSGSIRNYIETSVSDAKLKSANLLGLTRETVKQAVCRAIETSTEVEDDIINITRDATVNAMAEARFSAERISKVSETVLLAAVHAAEEIENHISETASAAAEGVRQGLSESIEFTHDNIAKAGRNMLLAGNLEQVQKDLEAAGDLFTETLRRVADKSGESAKEMLYDLADDAQKTGSTLREKAVLASRMVAERLKELGKSAVDKTGEVTSDTAYALSEESRILGNRMLVVAKSAANSVWESAKIAFYQDDNEKNRL